MASLPNRSLRTYLNIRSLNILSSTCIRFLSNNANLIPDGDVNAKRYTNDESDTNMMATGTGASNRASGFSRAFKQFSSIGKEQVDSLEHQKEKTFKNLLRHSTFIQVANLPNQM